MLYIYLCGRVVSENTQHRGVLEPTNFDVSKLRSELPTRESAFIPAGKDEVYQEQARWIRASPTR
jgi:hypothetical protein